MKGATQKHDGTSEETKSVRVKISTHKLILAYAKLDKRNIVDIVEEAMMLWKERRLN